MSRRIARVLLDSPLPQLDRLFDYAIPDSLIGEVQPGVRVRVPLRTAGRLIDGFVVSCGDENDDARRLVEIDAVVSTAAVLPSRLYELARRVADRAGGSAIDVVRLVVPKRQVRVEKAWLAADAPDIPELPDAALVKARETLDLYDGLSPLISARGRGAVEALPVLDEQDVPGWVRLLAASAVQTLAEGASSILVVPDQRDLDRLVPVLQDWVGDAAVVRVDAAQPNPDRYRAFLRTLDDAPCIVVGNRSAVYAPVTAGLVAIWDDGDSLLSEPLAPYVHARDAALVRQEREGSALLFTGHTRTTDVERLVASGWVRPVTALRRVLPRVVLDTAQDLDQRGQRIPSQAFLAARAAATEGPVLVQVARPGFAPTLVCAECRAPSRCEGCGGPLGAERRGATPTCGWCGRHAHAWHCAHCSSVQVRLASSGTERTAEELGRAFPGVRVIVADGAHPVTHVDGRPSLVVATRGAEPVAEGGYRAVVLLDGARMLQAPQLRIGESCLRWWSNAAALAAPGAPVHLVGVDGPVARALATWNHSAYARSELDARRPLQMPPTARVAQIEGTMVGVRRAIEAVGELGLSEDAVLGPIPVDDPDSPGRVRALVRFAYADGERVSTALRGAVIAEASGSRRGQPRARRTTLSVRFDVLEPEL